VNAAQLNGNSFCVILENIQFLEKKILIAYFM